uniref:Uncharacterized protein n=1 Tax=Romanomermis culicivorax TaxID=13658 RepID=A0A915KHP8_ROMCU
MFVKWISTRSAGELPRIEKFYYPLNYIEKSLGKLERASDTSVADGIIPFKPYSKVKNPTIGDCASELGLTTSDFAVFIVRCLAQRYQGPHNKVGDHV